MSNMFEVSLLLYIAFIYFFRIKQYKEWLLALIILSLITIIVTTNYILLFFMILMSVISCAISIFLMLKIKDYFFGVVIINFGVLLLLYYLNSFFAGSVYLFPDYAYLSWLIFVMFIGEIFVETVIARYNENQEISHSVGNVIGILERGLVFICICFNIIELILITGTYKAIVRYSYPSTNNNNDNNYYILGNVASMFFVVLTYLLMMIYNTI